MKLVPTKMWEAKPLMSPSSSRMWDRLSIRSTITESLHYATVTGQVTLDKARTWTQTSHLLAP